MFYKFWCEGGHEEVLEGSMANPPKPDFECSSCGLPMHRDFSGIRVDTFKPFVDIHSTGKPVPIETRRQRDEFCDKHNVTYDTGHYVRKPKYRPTIDDITYEDVMEQINKNGPATHELVREDPAEIATSPIESIRGGDTAN